MLGKGTRRPPVPDLGRPRVCRICELVGGGLEENNLEPETLNEILDELEDWGAVLRADADMTRSLAAIESDRVEGETEEDKSEDIGVTVEPDVQERSP